MSTHSISAGHGYTYLTRQTMAQDASVVSAGQLGAYYSERGEAPGRWMGRGLAGLDIEPGQLVSEEQMTALFGEGRHPNAGAIVAQLRAEGQGEDVVALATELGKPFALNLANNEYRRQLAQLAAEWNRAHGQPASAEVPKHTASRIRTAVAGAMFAAEHDREADAHELSAFVAQQSRVGSRAVAGYDLTFSPVKSVSALWALAPAAVKDQIEQAHQASVADALDWLERTATFTRLGRNGVRQVETRGLIAAAFVHRTSRAGDPDLHTHVAVSNKVQTQDGRWRALDGRVLFKATVAASERYNTRLEAELRQRLGVAFVDVERPGRRPVGEIAGVDPRLLAAWSSRRADIDRRRGELTEVFEREHGRTPTPAESIALAQQATLETRERKHDPAAEADQRQQWRHGAERLLGPDGAQRMVGAALGARCAPAAPTYDGIRAAAGQVIDRIQSDRATWQRWHVLAEAQRVVRTMTLGPEFLDTVVNEITRVALDECSIELAKPGLAVEPDALRRSDGTSVYTVAGSQLYSSRAVLAADQTVLDAATRVDGQRVSTAGVEMVLLEATANGLALNEGQVGLVRELAGSGARCQVALAPAGTGKTTALRVLARAWREDGGRVIAAAPSAAAARLLEESTAVPSSTLASLLRRLETEPLGTDHLVLVDEAGMASTPDLAKLVDLCVEAGASVRLIGDDRQLAAVGAGGVLRDLAETVGAATLTTAVRFADDDEAKAALGVRDGAPEALDFYVDHGRVHVGDDRTAALSAYRAWLVDRAAGRDSLLLAATRKQVAELNTRARADRLAANGADHGREVALADGCDASAGDAIVTRRNDRRLGISATDWVKNGDRWTVDTIHDDGSLTATHRDTGRHVVLSAAYVAEHVALGYAVTIHGAQGATADTCHTILTGTEAREQLYVAMSRGREANHVHVALPSGADEHAAIRRDSLVPPTAVELLQRILDREVAARSATTEQRAIANPAIQLRDAVDRFQDALTLAPSDAKPQAAAPAPLPWLEPVPTCRDEAWQRYLAARAEQITALADEITISVIRRQSPGAVLNRRDVTLQSRLALWRTVHPDGESSDHLTARERSYAAHLAVRRDQIHARQTVGSPDTERWRHLVDAVAPGATESPHYPELSSALSAAFDARLDVDRLLPALLHDTDQPSVISTLRGAVERAEREAAVPTPFEPLRPRGLGLQPLGASYEPPRL